MTFEINLEDYLTREQMENIAEEEFRCAFRRELADSKDVDRVLANIPYYVVSEELAKVWDGDLTEYLRDEAKKLLTIGDSNVIRFELFAEGNWGPKGPGKVALEGMMDELRPIIREEAEKRIREYPFTELERDEIGYTIGELITDILFAKEEEEE